MSFDPTGGVHLSFTGDVSDLNRAIDQAGRAVDGLTSSVDDLNRKKLSVAPDGQRELDQAAKSADGLSRGLDGAARSAANVKGPKGVDADLSRAAKAADGLGTELGEAASEADRLGSSGGGMKGMNGALQGVLSTAKQLAPALSAAAIAGTTFSRGWDRLTSIDNARFKLQGLGHDAESVSDIMDSAMTAVKGTAFGFGDAATIAAGAVAANIEPGKQLTDTLTAIADASAISGRGMDEMGSIFNKIASSGRIQAEELNQLADSGIPILQLLSEQMGVTASEVRDLASASEIGFAQFQAAIESGMGGAAQAMGESITGSLDNAGAAVGRLGAEVIGMFTGPGMAAMSMFTGGVDTLTNAVSGAVGVWEGLPAPVRDVAVAMGIATTAAKLLNTEAGQKLTSSIKEMVSGFAGSEGTIVQWGTNIRDAYLRGAQGSMDAAAAHRRAVVDIRDATPIAAGAWDAMDGSVRELGHTFGAWGNDVAGVMRGTASVVKTGVTSIVDALGGPLMLGLAGATWAIGQAVNEAQNLSTISDLADEVKTSFDGVGESIASSIAGGDISGAVDTVESELQGFLDAQQELADQTYNVWWGAASKIPEMIATDLNPFTERMGEDVTRELGELWDQVDEAQAFADAMENAGISAEELGDAVHGSEAQFRAMIGSLQEVGPETSSLQLHLTNLRAEWIAAEEAASGAADGSAEIAEGFAVLGDEAESAEDRVDSLNNLLREMAGIDMSHDEALAGFREEINGIIEDIEQVDAESGLGATLFGGEGIGGLNYQMDNAIALREELLGLQDAYGDVIMAGGDAQEHWETGISPALEGLASKYGLTRGEVDDLAEAINLVPETTVATIDVATTEAGEGVRQLWAQIEMGKDVAEEPISIEVEDTDLAIANLEALGFEVEALEDGFIEVTADTDQALGQIDDVIEAIALVQSPEGIVFSSNSRDEIELIRQLGWEVQETPDGDYRITSNTVDEIQEMMRLGLIVRDPMTGELTVESNIEQVLYNAGLLDERDGKETRESHTIDIFENHWTRRLDHGVQHTGGMEHGGRYLPAYAVGDRHEGYRLPTSGPGTETTDGFLAHDMQGAPAAWLDRGEWVINGDSSEKHNGLLHAVNRDDPAAIVAQAMRLLPRYASGGQHGGGATSGASGSAPDVGGEVETILTADTTDAAQAVAAVAQSVDALTGEKTIPVGTDTVRASQALTGLSVEIATLPEPDVPVEVDAAQAVAVIDNTSEALADLGEAPAPIPLTVDTAEMDEATGRAADELRRVSEIEAVPTARLDHYELDAGAADSTGTLDTLDAQHPVPTADLDHAMLDTGVAASMDGLERVGASKATSVSDVDNTSALVNIQGVIDELNKMPVERVIKVVAHGTSGLASGGEVPGLATGGTIAGSSLPTTGPGTDRVDGFLGVDAGGYPLVRVDAGEYVTNRKASQEYRTELELMNKGLFPKLDNLDMLGQGVNKVPGLFQGGVVSPDQLLSFAAGNTVRGHTAPRSLQGSPYIWGGGLMGNWGDCSGAMSGLAALAVGQNPAGRRFATMNQRDWLLSNGFRSGIGPRDTSFNLGWFNGGPWGGHTSGDIGGTAVEMGGGAGGNGKIGGAAASASSAQYTDHAHIALGELVAIDRYSPLPSVTTSRVPAAQGGYSPTGGHGVSGGGQGVTLHDQGGWLSPGSFAFNGLSEPEPVLTPNHWRLVERMVQAFPQQANLFIQAGRSFDDAAKGLDRVVKTLETPDGDDAAIIRALSGAAGGLLDMTGAGGAAGVVNGLVDAERVLLEQRQGQKQRAQEVADAERQLSEARMELAQLEAEAHAGMDVAAQRRLADAEKALAEARAGKDGEVDAEKVADAEEKLRRTREDVAADSVESEQRRQESVARANDNIIKAEEALGAARRKQIENLDMSFHSLVPGLSGQLSDVAGAMAGFAGQIAGLGGIGAQAAGALGGMAGQVAGLAAMAGPAGVSVGAVLAAAQAFIQALQVVGEIAGGIGDAVVGAFEGAASGANMMVQAFSRLNSTMQTANSMADEHTAAQMRVIESRIGVQDAVEALAEAERNAVYDRRQHLRNIQQAEFDLGMTRREASQVAVASESDLAWARQQGIVRVLSTSTLADATALQSASDVALGEARLAAARAAMNEADFNNTLQVAQATTALERAHVMAKIETDRLAAASRALANANALASGEIAGATGAHRYLEGSQMIAEGEALKRQGTSTQWSAWLNPTQWFQGGTFTGANQKSEGQRLIDEGRAMQQAYAEMAAEDIRRLDPEAQAEARKAIERLHSGPTGAQSFEQLLAGFVDVVGGTGGAASQAVSERQIRDSMRDLNRIIAESTYRTEAAAEQNQREQDRIDREQAGYELDWRAEDLATALGTWEQRNYLAEQNALMRDILAQHEQENAQLGQMNDKLTPKNMSVLMSVGGSGWGTGPAEVAPRVDGFGGISEADLSLLNSTRLEAGWADQAVARALMPSPGDFDGSGLADAYAGAYQPPAEGAVEAAAASAKAAEQATTATDRALAALLDSAKANAGKRSGTTFTGPVTVQGRDSDRLIESLSMALTRG